MQQAVLLLAKKFFSLSFLQLVQIFLGAVSSPFLNRVITPEQLGEFVSITFYISLFYSPIDGFFENIQHSNQSSSAECELLFLGGIVKAVVIVFASLFSFFLLPKDISLKVFFIYLALFFLEKIMQQDKVLLDKKSWQERNFFVEIFSSILAGLGAIFSFVFTHQYNLVIQKSIDRIIHFIFVKKLVRKELQDSFSWKELTSFDFKAFAKEWGSFFFATFLGNVAAILIYTFFPFLVCKFFGLSLGGEFAKASSLAGISLLLPYLLNKLFAPVWHQYRLDLQKIRLHILYGFMIKLLFLPSFFVLFLPNAAFIINFLLGKNWLNVSDILNKIWPYYFARAMYDDIGPIFNIALNKPMIMAKNQIFHAILILSASVFLFHNPSLDLLCKLNNYSMFLVCFSGWLNIYLSIKS